MTVKLCHFFSYTNDNCFIALNVYFVKVIKVLNKDGQNEIIKTKQRIWLNGRVEGR